MSKKANNDMGFHKMLARTMKKIAALPPAYFKDQALKKQEQIKAEKERDKLRDIRRGSLNYAKLLNDGGLSPFQVQRYRQLLKEQEEKAKH
jgi:hypothetical protein